MKKGFTLVELIATIIVLAIVGVIAFPIINNIIKENKENLYKSQIEEIELAAEKWAYLNTDLLPGNSETITVTILELKKAGFLPLDVRNPKTGELLPNDMEVTITLINNKYIYDVNEESGTNINSEFNENSPILILNGNALEYIEVGNIYSELGAKAKDKNGNEISNIDIMFQYNGTEIPSIDTNEFKTYTVIYSATSEVDGKKYTSSITRTVIVRDTTVPNLTVPTKANISLISASSYNLLEGVTATDNSGEEINVVTNGFDSTLGQKIVSYTACDSHNNCITKKRIINVLSNDAINPNIIFEIQPNSMILKPSSDFETNYTYTWYKDGIPVSTSSKYNLTSTGVYELEVKTNDTVKKSSKLEVLGYQVKYDKVLFVAKRDDNCVLRRNGSYEIEEFGYNDKCTITTALNMVKNGYLEYKDNTNFPQFTYDAQEDALYISTNKTIISSDYIPIDYNKTYNESIEIKSESTDFKHYAGIREYDIDKNYIHIKDIYFVNNTLTYLTQDLKNGDTLVYLNDISNFQNTETTPNYRLGLIFWDYKDSTGFTYPELSYSRNHWDKLYLYTGVDKDNNIITLKEPWSHGTYISGTKLSQSNDSTGCNYGLFAGQVVPSTYTKYSNTITDRQYPSNNNKQTFRYGTEYIVFTMLHNYNNSNPNTSYIKNIVITEE